MPRLRTRRSLAACALQALIALLLLDQAALHEIASASDVAPDPCLTATPTAELIPLLESPDPEERREAAGRLRRNTLCGGEANPAIDPLIVALDDPDPEVRVAAAGALHNFRRRALRASPALRGMLGDPDPRVRAAAARALGKVDPESGPVLLGVLADEDESVRSAAIFALQFGMVAVDEILPALDEALRGDDPVLSESVLRVAAGNETVAHVLSAEALLPFLDAPDPRLSAAAANVLGMQGEYVESAAAHFARVAQEERDPNRRIRALEQLGALGPAAADELPVFLIAMRDPDARVRASATFALRSLGSAAAEAAPLVAEALLDHENGFAELQALGAITSDYGPAMPGLIHQLSSPEDMDRMLAAELIGKAGLAGEAAVPALLEALADDGLAVREIAMALAVVGGTRPEVVEALREGTRSQDLSTSAASFDALEILGAGRDEVVADWLAQLEHEDDAVRVAAMNNLRELAWDQRLDRAVALEPLLGALDDSNRETRSSAAESIWMAWKDPELSLPIIKTQLEDRDRYVRDMALFPFSIGGLAAAAPESLPLVVARFRDPDRNVRLHAVGTVWNFGPHAEPAVPNLVELLSEPDDELLQKTCDALERIAPVAAEALQALERIESKNVRTMGAVRDAIAAIRAANEPAAGTSGETGAGSIA